MAAPMERLILQSDWEQSLFHEHGKVWVSFKHAGKDTVHGEIETKAISDDGLPYVSATDNFMVDRIDKKSIQITYSTDDMNCSRTFLAPTASYSEVHGNRSTIYSLDVTTGGLAVSSDSKGSLKIWETHTGAVRRELEGHFGDVYTCRFFPSGIVVLTGGADMQLKIWSADKGMCAATLRGHKAGILDTAIIDRGKNIVSCGRDGTCRLWDCGTQACLGVFETGSGEVNCCAIGTSGNNVDLGQQEEPLHEREVGGEGKLLLLGCENGMIQGFGVQSKKKKCQSYADHTYYYADNVDISTDQCNTIIFDVECHGAVNCCCFQSDTSFLCGSEEGYLMVTDIRNVRVPIKEWKESRSRILSLQPYTNGFFCSTGDGSCFYVNENFETQLELTGSDCDPLYRVVHDGQCVYTACRDTCVRKYRLSHVGL